MLKKSASFVLAFSLATALLDGHLNILLNMPSSQQFYPRLDDFYSGDIPNQVQCLVAHLIDISPFVGHARKPQHSLLPQILPIDLGNGEIELLPQSIFEAQQHLPLIF
jgi:hypothetical protein